MSQKSEEVKAALKALRKDIRWKTGKDIKHLKKRKEMGHLPIECSLKDFSSLIQKLVWGNTNKVYLYKFGMGMYYVIREVIGEEEWIVIFSKEGVVETAFPPDDIEDYVQRREMIPLGTVKEILER